jgi:hypothetical protein
VGRDAFKALGTKLTFGGGFQDFMRGVIYSQQPITALACLSSLQSTQATNDASSGDYYDDTSGI